MSDRDHRAEAPALADEFRRSADSYRTRARLVDPAIDPAIDPTFASAVNAAYVYARGRDLELARLLDLARSFFYETERASVRDLARQLDGIAATLCGAYGAADASRDWESRAGRRLLVCLARFLPMDDQTRFIAEALGNLADCDHRWQRVDHLVGLALGTPRLAWMMWIGHRGGQGAALHPAVGHPPPGPTRGRDGRAAAPARRPRDPAHPRRAVARRACRRDHRADRRGQSGALR